MSKCTDLIRLFHHRMIVSYHIRPIHVFHAKNIYGLRFSAVTEMTQSHSRTKHNHPIRSNPQSKFTTFSISLSCISHIFICKFQHNKPLKHDSSVFLQKNQRSIKLDNKQRQYDTRRSLSGDTQQCILCLPSPSIISDLQFLMLIC